MMIKTFKDNEDMCNVSYYFLSSGQWLRLGSLIVPVQLHAISPHVDVRLVPIVVRAILSVD